MRMILMKTLGNLVRSVAVNYDAMHEQNRICLNTKYGSDELKEATKCKEMYREWLLDDIKELKALGIDPEIRV